jgi:nitrous oxide reductase
MTDEFNPRNARRRFLQTSANAGLLGAALALLSRTAPIQAAEQVSAAASTEPPPSGYHETEHIRKYYAKARQF